MPKLKQLSWPNFESLINHKYMTDDKLKKKVTDKSIKEQVMIKINTKPISKGKGKRSWKC